MASTFVYSRFSSIIKVTGTPTATTGDTFTGKDAVRTNQSPWTIKGWIWSGTSKAAGDTCIINDGNNKPLISLSCDVANGTNKQFLPRESFIRSEGLIISALNSGTLYLYT